MEVKARCGSLSVKVATSPNYSKSENTANSYLRKMKIDRISNHKIHRTGSLAPLQGLCVIFDSIHASWGILSFIDFISMPNIMPCFNKYLSDFEICVKVFL